MRHFDDIPLLGQAALQVVGGLYFIFDDENLHSDVRSVASAILRPLSRRTVNERSPSAADSRLTTSSAIAGARSEEHTSELQSLLRISYAVFCLKKKQQLTRRKHTERTTQT